MSAPDYVPEEFRGTDLQSAYLDGYKDGREGWPARPEDLRNFCRAELAAYDAGRADGARAKRQGTGGAP